MCVRIESCADLNSSGQGTKETGLFIMDCLFSVLIVGSLVVVVWRGETRMWTMSAVGRMMESFYLSMIIHR